MSKHNKLSFLFFSLIILASASVCSCKNLFQIDFVEEKEDNITISGDVKAAAAGAIPSDYYSTNQNQVDNRSAFPANPSTIYYKVIAEDLNGKYSNVEGTISGSSYTISLKKSKWKLTANGYSDSDKTKLVVQAVYASLDLTNAETSTAVDLNAIPIQDASVKGYVKLAVSVEDASKISYAEISWKEGATTKVQKLGFTNAAKTQYFTMDSATPASSDPVEVTPGSYDVVFNYYDNSTASKKLLYSFTQIVNVYSNLTTNAWVGKASYISADGSITITNTMATYGTKTEFYVGTSGNDTTGTGGFFSPFKTVGKALKIIKSINDATTVYKVKLLSDLTAINGDIFTDVTYERCFVYITSDLTLNIEISSYNGPYKIDANGTTTNARVIFVGSNVNLTLENVIVTGGYIEDSNGAGIYVASNASLTLNSGAEIKGNTVVKTAPFAISKFCGGGVYIDSSGKFLMNAGTINNNIANDGAGLYIPADATSAEIKGGTIKSNEASDNGGGIWTNYQSNLKITNCTFNGNKAAVGGGIYIQNATEVSNCTFAENEASENGGAIAIVNGTTYILGSGSPIFKKNKALNGGAIYCVSPDSDTTLNIDGKCVFESNEIINSTGKGNAIYIGDGGSTTKQVYFSLLGDVFMKSGQIIYLDYHEQNTVKKQQNISLGQLSYLPATDQNFTLELGNYTIDTKVLEPTSPGTPYVSNQYEQFSLVNLNFKIDSDGKVKRKVVIADNEMKSLYDTATSVLHVPVSGKTYYISSENDLIYLRTVVNDGKNCSGVTFKLKTGLSITDEWTPIGISSLFSFSGTFDGCGNEIRNLVINSGSSGYCALFGYTKNTTIRNVIVSGSIKGGTRCAGIVADAIGDNLIENCINKASIEGSSACAGIVGYAAKNTDETGSCIIRNCINTGNITIPSTASQAGGILGASGSGERVEIINCGNTGKISGKSDLGGILGSLQKAGTRINNIYNCWNGGSFEVASGGSGVGAIIGSIVSSTNYSLNYCYYSTSEAVVGNNQSGNVAQTGSSNSSFTKSASTCTLSSTIYSTTDLKTALNSWITDSVGGNDSTYSTYNQWYTGVSGYPDFEAAPDPLPVAVPTSGTYTAVSNADFTTIADWVNSSADGLANVTIKLYDNLTINNWATPIGSSTKPFTGTFDGNGKTLTIDNITGSGDVGLFGYVENAVIKNLNVVGTPSGSSTGNVAGIVGHSKGNITIDNCTMNGYIGCSNATNVGGIIAYAETNNAAEKVIIKNCLNKNGIVGKDNVGGIIGCMSGHGSILIENCGSLISVQGQSSSYVGGIIGMANCSSTTLINCFNQSTVTPTPSFDGSTSGQFVGDIINTDDAGSMLKCYGKYALQQVYYGGADGFAGFNNDDNPNYEILQISGTSKSKCFISDVTPQKDLIDALNDWCNEKGSGYTLWKYTDDNGTIGFDN